MSTHEAELGQSLVECIRDLTGLVATSTVSNIHYIFLPSSRSLALHQSNRVQAVHGNTVQNPSSEYFPVIVCNDWYSRIIPQFARDPIVFSLKSSLLSTILQTQAYSLLVTIDLGSIDMAIATTTGQPRDRNLLPDQRRMTSDSPVACLHGRRDHIRRIIALEVPGSESIERDILHPGGGESSQGLLFEEG